MRTDIPVLCFSPQDKSLSTHQLVSTLIPQFLEDTLQQEEAAPILQHHQVLGMQGQQDILPLGATLEVPRLEECHLMLEVRFFVRVPLLV